MLLQFLEQAKEIISGYGLTSHELGKTTKDEALKIFVGEYSISLPISKLRKAWTTGVAEALR